MLGDDWEPKAYEYGIIKDLYGNFIKHHMQIGLGLHGFTHLIECILKKKNL